MLRNALSALSVVFLFAACTSNAGGLGTTGSASASSAPTCPASTFQMQGVVDGVDMTKSDTVGGSSLVNTGNPSKVDAQIGLGGALELEWRSTLASGQETDVTTGRLTLPSTGTAPAVTFCVGAGSRVEVVSGGIKFLLRGLTKGQSCPSGTTATGDILGCVGFKS